MKAWRIPLIIFFLFVFGGGLVARLAYLQIFNHGFYRALAQGQQTLPNVATGERGDIFFTDKDDAVYTLATNQELPFVFVTPLEVEDTETTAKELAQILTIPEEDLMKKLLKQDSFFEVVKKQIASEEEAALNALGLPGIYIQKETLRIYPQGELASRTLGFVNQEGKGQYGVEKYYQKLLEGKEGLKKTIRNVAGYLLSGTKDTLQHGEDLHLTIDFHIQSMAETLLEKANKLHNIEEGTIIVIESSTGKVLALANYPTFNPNSYSEVENLKVFQNPAVESIFEPGSVFKALTMASAIDAGAVNPNTTYMDKGIVRIGGYKILNYDERIWGERSMTEVLEFSINTGAVYAEQQLGHKKFLEYLEKFGIFEPTNIDIAGEIYSANKELKKGYEITYATASFGQGIEMTPLQMVRAFSALANQGRMITPYLVEKPTVLSEAVISQRTASQITSMLVSVVENGFAKAARIPGYYLAGKTGTAQISWSALGISKPEYADTAYSDKTIQSFIGYAPAFQPRFLALVKLNNPETKTAEYSAVPIFKELVKYIIDYYEIPPDYEE
tara:strand:+ start:8862 stop:10538 length:1677 start_codon:yes stop_codon:yes gene_type:complete